MTRDTRHSTLHTWLAVKPKLLVVELWGMGDLVIATPFLQAASEKYALTLLAKPYALDLQQRFWPRVNVVPFIAPWTAFQHKYRLWGWPWRQMFSLLEQLAGVALPVDQVAGHPDELGALTWKQEGETDRAGPTRS